MTGSGQGESAYIIIKMNIKRAVIIFAIILIIITIAASSAVVKNMAAKAAAEKITRRITGLRLIIDDFDMSILKTSIVMKELLLLNPKGFSEKIMFDIAEAYIDYDFPGLLKKKLYFKKLRLNVTEFSIIRNADGELNLAALNLAKAKEKEGVAPAAEDEKPPKVKIDLLELKIGKVIYKDYTQGAKPFIVETNLNIDEKFKNITDAYSIMNILVVEAVKKAALEQYLSITLEGLIKPVAKTLQATQQLGSGTVTVIKEAGKQVSEAVKKAAEGLSGTMQTTAEKIDEKEQTGKEGEEK